LKHGMMVVHRIMHHCSSMQCLPCGTLWTCSTALHGWILLKALLGSSRSWLSSTASDIPGILGFLRLFWNQVAYNAPEPYCIITESEYQSDNWQWLGQHHKLQSPETMR
jgi:hypothetical protein